MTTRRVSRAGHPSGHRCSAVETTAGACDGRRATSHPPERSDHVRPSVQLYTVRDAVSADLQGAVARVAEIGYTQVEPYAFVERADEFAAAFAASGVTAPSGHAPVIDGGDDQAARTFDAAAKLGIQTVIDPFIPSERWQTADDAHRIADRVNELQVQAAARGLAFGYHNHQWEFANTVDGRPIYEALRRAPQRGCRARGSTPSGRPSAAWTRPPCLNGSATACSSCT
ncbi:sugar phosphate isomerase/epimerase family protein [Clavibacter tessellarius]|uniref:sugar phosphate isomerase/epimerase family protein n=1 Tax=Clavibacter tessellarius TaxID=31965 RepID=UPI0039BEF720